MENGQRTLVVDDDVFIGSRMELMLNLLGITDVTRAVNGLQAVELFGQALKAGKPYSLVFLDIIMPEMDGQEALKRIRTMEREAGVSGTDRSIIIMTTSLGSPNDMMEAMFEGDCNDYIVKPVDEAILGGMLTRYGLIM
ncbi:MAG: response regulator [Deltaproteobacteria bacterium]|nr:response regulator [Deltaproteobacteria bacterium]